MTLETCKKRLELAEEKKDEFEIAFWKERIERKLRKPKYAEIAGTENGRSKGRNKKN